MKKISLDQAQPDETKTNWREMAKRTRVHIDVVPPRPPLAISIGLDDREYKGVRYPRKFGSMGNISVIMGEEKSRKSFLRSLILSCAIGGKANNFSEDIRGHNLEDRYIFDLDTEQGTYDSWLNAKRIPEMCGAVPENYLYFGLRELSKNEIRGFVEWLFMESEYRNKMGITCIDGYVDMVDDFNSNTESDERIRELMKYSSVSKSHITGVLHLNPNSDKGRGHFGTMLAQKAEMVAICKDEGEFSSVRCKRVRGSQKFEEFTIRVNDDWLPYVSADEITSALDKISLK